MSMFGTPKPMASLSSGLLARKGHARPAMRPQGFIQLNPSQPDDLGWNDMGDEFLHARPDATLEDYVPPHPVPVEVTAPVAAPEPPVLRQRAALGEQFGSVPAVPAPEPIAALEPETAFEPDTVFEPEIAPESATEPVAEALAPQPVAEAPAPQPAAKAPAPVKTAPTISRNALARVAREAVAKKSKAAFTLRLDTDRHLRLRLASAVRNQSAQQLVTEALDAFLESLTDVDVLARQLDPRNSRG